MSVSSDRNLLFGVLALQTDVISAKQLIAAMHAWAADKSKSIGEILVAQEALTSDHFGALDALVGAQLKVNGDDAQSSLAQLSAAGTVAHVLAEVDDDELAQSLRTLEALNGNGDAGDEQSETVLDQLGASTERRFEILKLHDEGGLGRVFVAEDKELGRQVAVKELKDDLAKDQGARSRFVAEAEINGGLEHPGIVPVYGLGKYRDGRPFYAMRFIQGENLRTKINEFHDKDWSQHGGSGARTIEMRRLLNGFIDVCEAVHYAHKRGVLHRDIKPHNIMVGRYGETLLVDWGLAKWLGQREFGDEVAAETTLMPRSGSNAAATMQGSAIGTPAFMSPEQARGEHTSLGPAADIFSLGATLYMLLTNERPYKGEKDVLAASRMGHFKPPRTVLSTVPRPLEAICLKAMQLDPDDRYESAQALAQDVEQYLGDEPVNAYRESAWERGRRWLRQHSTLAALSVAIGAAAVAFSMVGSAFYSSLAAEKELSERVVELMVDAFGRADADKDGRTVTVVEVLDDTLEELAKRTDIDERIKAELLKAIGKCYYGLGLYEEAIDSLSQSYSLLRDDEGQIHETLSAINELGEAHRQNGDFELAAQMHRLALRERRRLLGDDHPSTLLSQNNLAAALAEGGKLAEAITLVETILKQRTKILGPDSKETLETSINLALMYQQAGRIDAAARIYADAEFERRLLENLGTKTSALTFFNNKAAWLYGEGRLRAALAILENVVSGRLEKLGVPHDDTSESMHSLGRCQESIGQLQAAQSTYREAAAAAQTLTRRQSELKALQGVQLQLGEFAGALKTIEIWQELMSIPHSTPSKISKAEALLGTGDVEQSLAIFQPEIEEFINQNPPNKEAWRAQSVLGSALANSPETRERAEQLMLDGYQQLRDNLSKLSPHYRWYCTRAAERLVEFYREHGSEADVAQWEIVLADVRSEIADLIK